MSAVTSDPDRIEFVAEFVAEAPAVILADEIRPLVFERPSSTALDFLEWLQVMNREIAIALGLIPEDLDREWNAEVEAHWQKLDELTGSHFGAAAPKLFR